MSGFRLKLTNKLLEPTQSRKDKINSKNEEENNEEENKDENEEDERGERKDTKTLPQLGKTAFSHDKVSSGSLRIKSASGSHSDYM